LKGWLIPLMSQIVPIAGHGAQRKIELSEAREVQGHACCRAVIGGPGGCLGFIRHLVYEDQGSIICSFFSHARLYPAMPFTSYSYMTDADALAIKAYLFSLTPVRAVVPANALTFPFNQRWAMNFWSPLFNSDTRFAADVSKSLEWNRGAYLVEALAHCGECHTPRNVALALDNRKKFAGAVTAGWRACNITSDKATGIGDWRDEDIIAYLSLGHATGHGTASGPMGEAVDHSFSQMAPEDIRAVVSYLRTIPPIASRDLPEKLRPPASASHKQGGGASNLRGKMVFEGACVSCHEWTGESSLSPSATLTGAVASTTQAPQMSLRS
jgi:mono/diheme cytochrome c family protein